jgi:hypothetical protein
MKTVSISETSVNLYQTTRRNIPEYIIFKNNNFINDSKKHTNKQEEIFKSEDSVYVT